MDQCADGQENDDGPTDALSSGCCCCHCHHSPLIRHSAASRIQNNADDRRAVGWKRERKTLWYFYETTLMAHCIPIKQSIYHAGLKKKKGDGSERKMYNSRVHVCISVVRRTATCQGKDWRWAWYRISHIKNSKNSVGWFDGSQEKPWLLYDLR